MQTAKSLADNPLCKSVDSTTTTRTEPLSYLSITTVLTSDSAFEEKVYNQRVNYESQ